MTEIAASAALERSGQVTSAPGECILFLGAGINVGLEADAKFSYPEEHRPPLCRCTLAKRLVAEDRVSRKTCPPHPIEDLTENGAFGWKPTLGRHAPRAASCGSIFSVGRQPSHGVANAGSVMPFRIFITTNYDNLLEQALSDEGKEAG